VVIAERSILIAAKRRTVKVVINSRVTSTVIGEVVPLVDPDVSVPIHRYVVACTNLFRVAITINLSVSHVVRREVSVAINRNIISRASCSWRRRRRPHCPRLGGNIVSFARHAHLVLIDDCV
jgi:hypothetical protein